MTKMKLIVSLGQRNQQLKKYPLLPYSQLVYDSIRWTPWVYRFPVTFVWRNGASEQERIENAIRTTLENHPVFSMQIDRHGRHYEAPLKDILHGRYHDYHITADGVNLVIQVEASRVLGDGRSADILMEDVLRAYEGLPLQSDDYWEYLEYVEQQKHSRRYADSKLWLEKEFADENVPIHPTLDRHLWTLLPPKAGLYKANYSVLRDKINFLSETEFLSMDGFFSLCSALAIAEYCGTDSAALTWAYEGRERPEEQRIFGSLHRDIPFHINVKGEKLGAREGLIRQARNQIRSGIAHSDYPYTLTRPHTERWNYAVNVLRVMDEDSVRKLLPSPLELLSLPKQKYAYALLDVEIHESADRLEIWYRYSATHYKEESIRKFAALVRKYVEWLID